MTEDKVQLSLENSKFRFNEKTNGKGEMRKMKITIDLAKEEAEAFKSIASLRPEGLSMDQFAKNMFVVGCNNLLKLLQEEALKAQAANGSSSVEEITPPEDNSESILAPDVTTAQ